jgi:hypothetical protein
MSSAWITIGFPGNQPIGPIGLCLHSTLIMVEKSGSSRHHIANGTPPASYLFFLKCGLLARYLRIYILSRKPDEKTDNPIS